MLTLLIIAVVVVVAVGVAGAVALANSSRREYRSSNEVVAGHPSPAPASWAGSHEPAARLHRRLRDSMRALSANRSFDDDGALLDLRVELEHQAITLDERLVAVGALPAELQREPLVEATAAVEAIEVTVARLASSGLSDAQPMLEQALHRVQERSDLIDRVRMELDQIPVSEPEPEIAPELGVEAESGVETESRVEPDEGTTGSASG